MPLPGKPTPQNMVELDARRYWDTDKVKKAIMNLARSNRTTSYVDLRDILRAEGSIVPLKTIKVLGGVRAPPIPSFQLKEEESADPETLLLESLLTKPLSRKESLACEREMVSARHRETLNTDRANAELAHYRGERIRVKQRIRELELEIDKIGLRLHALSKKKQEDISRLQALYDLERLQKQEELMRLQDILLEIEKYIQFTLNMYEDKRTLAEIGGTRRRSRSRRCKSIRRLHKTRK